VQESFRKYQPFVLTALGKHYQTFPVAGAEPYKNDLKKLEFHLLNARHLRSRNEWPRSGQADAIRKVPVASAATIGVAVGAVSIRE